MKIESTQIGNTSQTGDSNNALKIGQRAFDAFKNAIEVGDVNALIELMHDDVSFYVPIPFEEWRGEQRGRERLRELIQFERDAMELRVKFTQVSIAAANNIAAVEFQVEGTNKGGAYRNHIAIFFEITGEKVTAFREYAGDIDPQAVAAVNG